MEIMNAKAFILEFTVIFMITFVAASIVSFGWNYISEGSTDCNWGLAIQLALLFAVICPLIDIMKNNKGT